MALKTVAKRLLTAKPFQPMYRFARNIPGRPSLFKHLPVRGVFSVDCGSNRTFRIAHHGYKMENELFWGGLDDFGERESLRLWLRAAAGANTIFDVGANTGVYALAAGAVRPAASIHAFEPIQRIYERLKANCSLNDFEVVSAMIALSNEDGSATISDTDDEHVYGATLGQPNAEHWPAHIIKREIVVARGDTYLRLNGIERVDLMKIDVETHEPEVLEGFGSHIRSDLPTLLIEVVEDRVLERLRLELAGLDYVYFDVDETTGPRRIPEIAKSSNFNLFICRPAIAQALELPR